LGIQRKRRSGQPECFVLLTQQALDGSVVNHGCCVAVVAAGCLLKGVQRPTQQPHPANRLIVFLAGARYAPAMQATVDTEG